MMSEEKFIVVKCDCEDIRQHFPVGTLVKPHAKNAWRNIKTRRWVYIGEDDTSICIHPLPRTPEEIEIFSMLYPDVKLAVECALRGFPNMVLDKFFIVLGYGPSVSGVSIERWEEWFPVGALCIERSPGVVYNFGMSYRGRVGKELVCRRLGDLSGDEVECYRMLYPELEKLLQENAYLT